MRTDRNHVIAQEAVDKALEQIAEPLRHLMSICDWYDPWGAALGWAWALNETAYYRLGITTDPTFKPSLGAGPDDESYEWEQINWLLDAGLITSGEVGLAVATMSVLLHALEMIPDIRY